MILSIYADRITFSISKALFRLFIQIVNINDHLHCFYPFTYNLVSVIVFIFSNSCVFCLGRNQMRYTEEDLRNITQFEITKKALSQVQQDLTKMTNDRDIYRRSLKEEEKGHRKTTEKYEKNKCASKELVYLHRQFRKQKTQIKQLTKQNEETNDKLKKLEEERTKWEQTVEHLSNANEQLRLKDAEIQGLKKKNEELCRANTMRNTGKYDVDHINKCIE